MDFWQRFFSSSGSAIDRACSSYWHGWTPAGVALSGVVALIIAGYIAFELGRARGARAIVKP